MDSIISWLQNDIGGDALHAWIAAIVLVVVTGAVSAILTRIIRKLMQVDGSPLPESSIIINIVRIVVWVIGLSIMLSACFNVDVNGLIAALGIGGVALSLGVQDTVKNFIGGLQVTLMDIVHPGDHISVGGVEGIVQDVSWRQTVVKDYENIVHLIPNAIMAATTVSKVEPQNLASTVIVLNTDGRDLGEVVREMEQLAAQAVRDVAPMTKEPWILVTHVGEYGIWAKMRFVLEDVEHAREARDAALRVIAPYTRISANEVLLDSGEED